MNRIRDQESIIAIVNYIVYRIYFHIETIKLLITGKEGNLIIQEKVEEYSRI